MKKIKDIFLYFFNGKSYREDLIRLLLFLVSFLIVIGFVLKLIPDYVLIISLIVVPVIILSISYFLYLFYMVNFSGKRKKSK